MCLDDGFFLFVISVYFCTLYELFVFFFVFFVCFFSINFCRTKTDDTITHFLVVFTVSNKKKNKKINSLKKKQTKQNKNTLNYNLNTDGEIQIDEGMCLSYVFVFLCSFLCIYFFMNCFFCLFIFLLNLCRTLQTTQSRIVCH